MTININSLPGGGAEITGVDIDSGLSGTELTRIHECFAEQGLVFFRDQKLTEENHISGP